MAFFRTRISIDVLSEEPLGDVLSLAQVEYAISEGDCVGYNMKEESTELTAPEMAKALIAAGSEPSFFGLDDDGNPVEPL